LTLTKLENILKYKKMIEGTINQGVAHLFLHSLRKKTVRSFFYPKVRKTGKSKIMPGIEEQGVTTRGTHLGEQLMAQSKEQRVGNT
jgi:hypothetical protein